ncbi:substrate-binding domain-containing protein [Vreelandella salicampi]|uniref:Substrate-binding domain-containing protein n=1 Tax=Vreelandella salicampi TaxID=1449798 RepID=A0A7Z0RU31_9GAMM|nr:substrate-binding domain-containing protein [Halomonas salicampi]NYS60039.1 substrate-binding domain-containing protein [Halomonas salicampi]
MMQLRFFSLCFLMLVSCLLWPLASLATSPKDAAFSSMRVGFAQDTLANGSVAQQALHIRRLANEVDVLLVSPRVKAVLSQVIADVYDAGVPVILVDRGIDSQRFTSFVRPSNTVIGNAAAQHLVEALGQSGTVLMLKGVEGASATEARSSSFETVIKQYPSMRIIARTGNYLRVDALRAVQQVIDDGITFDAVYAQSDSMATGARMAMTHAGLDPSRIPIIGVDYIQEAKTAILDGTQSVSFTYPTGGRKAAELAVRLLHDEAVPKHLLLPTVKVTKDNARDVEVIF